MKLNEMVFTVVIADGSKTKIHENVLDFSTRKDKVFITYAEKDEFGEVVGKAVEVQGRVLRATVIPGLSFEYHTFRERLDNEEE